MSLKPAEPSSLEGQPANLPELEGYDLVDCIGRGGMGVVYEAYQQATGRQVAVKFMLGGNLASETARRRFEREVELVARLQHPNIVNIIDSGLQRDRYYYVMEYVEGQPLDKWQWARIDDALRLSVAVCEAVDHAHQRAVLHRDLKPSNILVDSQHQPHLLDFGLAKLLDEGTKAERAATLSEPGQLLGTLAYMSPEQFRGATDAVSVRSDVYSLGAILYELLTGRPPVDVDGSMDQVVHRVLLRDPHPPSLLLARKGKDGDDASRRRSALSWSRPGLLGDLDAVVLKAIEKDPNRRYATARELAEDLQRCLSGEVVAARRAGTMTRIVRWTQRHRAVSIITAVAALLTLSTAIYSYIRVTGERNRAEASARELSVKVGELTRVLDFTKSMISRTAKESNHERDIQPLLAMLADAEQRAPIELAGHAAAEAALRLSIGETYEALGKYEEAERNYRHMLVLHRDHSGEFTVEMVTSLLHLANTRGLHGDFSEGASLCEQAVTIARKIYGEETEGMLAPLHSLSYMLQASGSLEKSETILRQTLDLHRRLLPENEASIVDGLNSLASLRKDRGDIAEAERLYREALDINRRLSPGGNSATVMIQNNLALILLGRDLAEAERMFRDSLAIHRSLLGDGHPDVMASRNKIGITLLAAGNYRGAGSAFHEIIEAHQRASRAEDESLAAALGNLGNVLFIEGEFEEAHRLFHRSASIFGRIHEKPTADGAIMRTNVAASLEALGRFDEAEAECRASLDMLRGLAAPRDDLVAIALSTLGQIRYDLGDLVQAESHYREAIAILRQQPEEGGAGLASPLVGLGQVLAARGDPAGAEQLCREALDRLRGAVGDKHPDVAAVKVRLASALRDQDRFAAAEVDYGNALHVLSSSLGEYHPLVAMAMHEWADLRSRTNDVDTALTLWNDALEIRRCRLPPGHPDIIATEAALSPFDSAEARRTAGL